MTMDLPLVTAEPPPGPNKRGYTSYIAGPFDYGALAADLAEEARAAAERITSSQRQHLIDVGQDLLEMKDKLAHGQFEEWCDRALFMTPRTARNYMQVARQFASKSEIVSVLPAASVYKLAYAPDSIRQGIVARVEAGEYVDRNEVDEAIRRPKFEAAEKKWAAVEQEKKEAVKQRRRQRREQNSRARWEAEEAKRRAREAAAAQELIQRLSAHCTMDEILELNTLWREAGFGVVRNAVLAAPTAAEPSHYKTPESSPSIFRDGGAA